MNKQEQARTAVRVMFGLGVVCGLIGLIFHLDFVGAFGLIIAVSIAIKWFSDAAFGG